MLIKKESEKVFELTVKGWDGKRWSSDIAEELLVDPWWLDHQDDKFGEGYTLTQAEFDEVVALLKSDAENYNAGGDAGEWLVRNGECQKQDFEQILVNVEFSYVDED